MDAEKFWDKETIHYNVVILIKLFMVEMVTHKKIIGVQKE